MYSPELPTSSISGIASWEYRHCLGRTVFRSHNPQVTNVELWGERLLAEYQATNISNTLSQVGSVSTMSWVIPVSSVQKGVMLATPTGLTYWWNWLTTLKSSEWTIRQGNSMISWGSICSPLRQFASKSNTRKCLNFCFLQRWKLSIIICNTVYWWYLTIPLGSAMILKNNEDFRDPVNLIQSMLSEKCRRHEWNFEKEKPKHYNQLLWFVKSNIYLENWKFTVKSSKINFIINTLVILKISLKN